MVYTTAGDSSAPALTIDTGRVERAASFVDSLSGVGARGEARDATGRYIQSLLRCPSTALGRGAGAQRRLLETNCNFR